MRKIIGFIGQKGAGKDTAAQALVERGWMRLAFADAVYQEVADAFNVPVAFLQNRDTKETPLPELALSRCNQDVEYGTPLYSETIIAMEQGEGNRVQIMNKPRSPRRVLQTWGDEYRRKNFRDDYWTALVEDAIASHAQTNVIVTDVRYINEAQIIQHLGGMLARIVRPELDSQADAASLHVSEQQMLNYPTDYTFINDDDSGGIMRLKSCVTKSFG